jgi:hypothetical protein
MAPMGKDRPVVVLQTRILNGTLAAEYGHSVECSLHRRPEHYHGAPGIDHLGACELHVDLGENGIYSFLYAA